MSFNIVLVQPEIPQNTGNIARTCVVTGSALHIVKPIGFSLDQKHIRRAGLDYWKDLTLYTYENMKDFYTQHLGGEFWYLSSKVKKKYTDAQFSDNCFLIFGNETCGLRTNMPQDQPDYCITIPMICGQRCLNLSNAVCVVLYEALRQRNFTDL